MTREDWLLASGLIILFVIGVVGFWAPLYIPPLAALAKDGVNEQWLGFAGNIVAAFVTLTAAAVAWFAVQQQIQAQAALAERQRAQKEFAAKAILPLSLSALYAYAEECVSAIDALPDPIAPGTVFKTPTIPMEDVGRIKEALENMPTGSADEIADMLRFLQIHHARLVGLEASTLDGSVGRYALQRHIINSLNLLALMNRSFIYARGKDFEAPEATADELRQAFDLSLLNDVEYPVVLAEISRRQPAESKLNT